MAVVEDIDGYFADFGVVATYGAESANVLFDTPDEMVGAVENVSTGYQITYKTGVFAAMKFADTITVAGVSYSVRYIQKINDGALSRALLSKV